MRQIRFLLFAVISSLAAGAMAIAAPVAVEGVLDLRQWDFAADGPVALNGQWEFFWNELLNPSAPPDEDRHHSPRFMPVPGSWVGYATDEGRTEPEGFATYRLRVLLPADNHLALHIPYAQTAYQLWINEIPAGAGGVVATAPRDGVPAYRATLSRLPADAEIVDIVLHVSNFDFREGGLARSLYIDDAERAALKMQRDYAVGAILFGSSFIIGLYHLFLFLWQRERRSYLYLAILALVVALRTTLTGSQLIQILLPDMPWSLQIRLEYLTGYLAPLAFLYFFHTLFPREVAPIVRKGWFVIASVGIALTLVVPPRFSSQLIPFYLPLAASLIVYLFANIIVATVRKREGAPLLLSGAVVFLICSGLTLLYYRGYFVEYDLLPHGFVVFLLSQALLLAKRSSDAFRREKALAKENAGLLLKTKKQLQQLRTFRQEMVEREVRVRERIADMLHGRTQARLLLAAAQADKAMATMDEDVSQARESLQTLKTIVDQVRDEDIRQASHSLHPATVAAGLVPALDTLLKSYDEMFTIHWEVSDEAEQLDDVLHGTISQPARFRLYRIAEEALNNVARHASADTIWLSLTVEPAGTAPSVSPMSAHPVFQSERWSSTNDETAATDNEPHRELVLTLRDNGRGIEAELLEPGYGLQAVAALVDDLEGTYAFYSAPRQGSILIVRVPMQS